MMKFNARGASVCTVSGSKTDEKLLHVVLNENQGKSRHSSIFTILIFIFRVSNIHNTSSIRPCAVFNGTFIITTDCGLQPDNGVLCMTPFGK